MKEKTKKILLLSLGGAFLALAISSFEHCKYVLEGKISYNRGPIQSDGFYWCSAVILDYENKAIYTHDLAHFSGNKTDVVNKIVKEANKRGFELDKSFAIINAGRPCDLESISNDFKEYGIEIRCANTTYTSADGMTGPRKVRYDPKENKLEIRKGILKKVIDLN